MYNKCQEILDLLKDKGIISPEQRNELEIEFVNADTSETKRRIASLLRNLGIPAHVRGYNYLIEAIQILLKKPNLCCHSVTKILYPEIAEKFNTSPSKVERCLRWAIELGWNRGNLDLKEEIFGYTVNPEKGKPTNSEFIAGIVEYIKLN